MVHTHEADKIVSVTERPLLEEGAETFIRYNEAIAILHKVHRLGEESFANLISANDPFGFDVRVENSYRRIKPTFKKEPFDNCVIFYYNGWRKQGVGYIERSFVKKHEDWIDKYKVYIPKAWGIGVVSNDWIKPFLGEPNSCCTETYLLIGPFEERTVAENIISYTQTKFFHFVLSLKKITQNTMKSAYSFVPMQDFSKPWTDEELYRKYGLTEEEIAFIEKMVRPMDTNGAADTNDNEIEEEPSDE